MNEHLHLFDAFNEYMYLIQSDLFPNNESDEIEYKSAAGGFPRDFWKTYCAFANTSGGVIVLGVKERKGKFYFDGLTNDQLVKYQKEFWNNVNNRQHVSLNILRNDDVREFELNGSRVLCFNIEPAERKQKPIYLTQNPFGNTYKRNYDGDYQCKDEEVRRMLADSDPSYSPDSRILEGYSFDDLDSNSLKQYRQIFAVLRPSHPWIGLDDVEFLENIGGYRKDRKSQQQGFTMAGMLMFGKYKSITDEECCPKFFPDYREIISETDDTRWTDRIYPDGTWEGNLFQFYKLVYPKLSHRLPKPFRLSLDVRIDNTPAHIALREAFVNALIHADYNAPGSIIIKSSPNAFVFINPGTLLVTLSQFYKGGISQCRNSNLQKMFLLIGGAEKAGSGVNKIISGWSASHWRRPYVSLEGEPDRIALELPLFSIIPEETLIQLKLIFTENVETLGKDELTALAVCHIEGGISNRRLQFLIDKHKSDITTMLQSLCRNGYLVSENKSRWTLYRLNYNPNFSLDTTNLDSSPANLDGSPTNLDSSLANLDSSPANLDGSIVVKDYPKRGRKKFEELEKEILEVCRMEYKSAFQISKEIGKTEKYLKNDILPRMIASNKLTKLYSDNHPHQKYITKNHTEC